MTTTSSSSLLWRCRDRSIDCGERPRIMGVLNVTPDSFSDGGRFLDPVSAVIHARQMVADGADIVDIGGESSRPGAEAVDAAEELRRILPVVRAVADEGGCLVSIDTTKAAVARAALESGAHIVNDISALTMDPALVDVVRATGAGVVVMHMQGSPRTMQADPKYGDVVADVTRYLSNRLKALEDAGIEGDRIAVDPGIGFGKTVEHNIALLQGLPRLAELGRPVLVGLSRKSFLGSVTGRGVDDRLAASLGGLAFALMQGAHLARVHDVKESCDVARLIAILRHRLGDGS